MFGKMVQNVASKRAPQGLPVAKPIGAIVKAPAGRSIGAIMKEQAPAAGSQRSAVMPSTKVPAERKGAFGKMEQNLAAKRGQAAPAERVAPKGMIGVAKQMMEQRGKGLMPVKRAQGGAGKVRKGMMSQSGDIMQAVKPKRK